MYRIQADKLHHTQMNRADPGAAKGVVVSWAQGSTRTWTEAAPAAEALIWDQILGDAPELCVHSEQVQEVTVQRLRQLEE